MSRFRLAARPLLATLALAAGCVRHSAMDEHDHGDMSASAPSAATSPASIAAGAGDVAARLMASPRHQEWVYIHTGADSIRAYVVYPERATKAPVVVVIHEIFGLSGWVRGVADQLAADGYIAIAPDLLTGMGTRQGDTLTWNDARGLIGSLKQDDIHRQLAAIGKYGMSLPAAQQKYGIVGFCWGGSNSFAHAVRSPEGLGAAVVYYGTSPSRAELERVRVPVLGLYGGNDARVDATIPPADSAMKQLGKVYEPHVFAGAGHGFLRAQTDTGATGAANRQAALQAWPLTIGWFRRYLGR